MRGVYGAGGTVESRELKAEMTPARRVPHPSSQLFTRLTIAILTGKSTITGMKTDKPVGTPGAVAAVPRMPPMRETIPMGAHLRDWIIMFRGSRVRKKDIEMMSVSRFEAMVEMRPRLARWSWSRILRAWSWSVPMVSIAASMRRAWAKLRFWPKPAKRRILRAVGARSVWMVAGVAPAGWPT